MRLTVAGEIGTRQPTAPPDSSMIARIPSAAASRSAPRAASTTCRAPRWTLPAWRESIERPAAAADWPSFASDRTN